jgi:hypothetical protein
VRNKITNIINHIGFVIDKSSSMSHLQQAVVKVFDDQVKNLVAESKGQDQETRVSVWQFADSTENLVWDKDVLRMPSLAGLYVPQGNTALMDATAKAVSDLQVTPQMYGDHSFLLFVITDGEENRSRSTTPLGLKALLQGLPDNWTVAALVPNVISVMKAKNFGFPAGNIITWDTTSAAGLEEASQTISTATTNYMTARSTGLRNTTSLFTMDPARLNKAAIDAAGLKPLDTSKYMLIPVVDPAKKWPKDKIIISEYVRDNGLPFQIGKCFYQLINDRVKVQGNKEIVIVGKKDSKVYAGPQARQMLGLPDHDVTIVRDQINKDYDVFIQSTAPNRHLKQNTRVLVLK